MKLSEFRFISNRHSWAIEYIQGFRVTVGIPIYENIILMILHPSFTQKATYSHSTTLMASRKHNLLLAYFVEQWEMDLKGKGESSFKATTMPSCYCSDLRLIQHSQKLMSPPLPKLKKKSQLDYAFSLNHRSARSI